MSSGALPVSQSAPSFASEKATRPPHTHPIHPIHLTHPTHPTHPHAHVCSANGLGTYTVKTIAILMNVGNVIITVVSAWLMDRAGRRLLLLASTISMIVAIGILTLALTHPGEDWTAPCAIVGVVSFVMSFGVGMGPVPWLLPAELFPADRVAIGSSFAASCNWLANFLSVLAFLPLSDALGGLCFLPFAAVLVPFALFVWTRVPETRGKSVQQILNELKTS